MLTPEEKQIRKRAANRRYRQSEKGKAVKQASRERYNISPKGEAAKARYERSDKGKATRKRCNKRAYEKKKAAWELFKAQVAEQQREIRDDSGKLIAIRLPNGTIQAIATDQQQEK